MSSNVVQVSAGGRIVIPAVIRRKMSINTGDQVVLTWSDDSQELRIASRKQRLQAALDLVKKYAKVQGSVVEELIAERRQASVDE